NSSASQSRSVTSHLLVGVRHLIDGPEPGRVTDPTEEMIVHSELEARDGASAIEATDLRKTYPGGIEAVRGVTFDVAPGEAFGLLGPNGAGKSTTVGMLTTTIRPTAGSARLDGVDVTADPRRARAVASVVFQEAVVDRSLTGRQAIQLHARLW